MSWGSGHHKLTIEKALMLTKLKNDEVLEVLEDSSPTSWTPLQRRVFVGPAVEGALRVLGSIWLQPRRRQGT